MDRNTAEKYVAEHLHGIRETVGQYLGDRYDVCSMYVSSSGSEQAWIMDENNEYLLKVDIRADLQEEEENE